MPHSRYVILTSAHNEERFLVETIKAVLAQSVSPLRWVLINDGSSDGTEDIVQSRLSSHSFLSLMQRPARTVRSFGSKAVAINEAYDSLSGLSHEFVAILDADVTLPSDYYEQVMAKFDQDENLGLAGGVLYDLHDGTYFRQRTNPDWNVAGPVQMFRRQCFEDIHGYRAVRKSIDGVAEVMSRMHGWKVKGFPEIIAFHNRETGTYNHSLSAARFISGTGYYAVGYHPLYMLARCAARLGDRPLVIGSLLELLGYATRPIVSREKDVPKDYVRYARREQILRLASQFRLAWFSTKLRRARRSSVAGTCSHSRR